jgi:hypothetical protein
MKHTKVCGICGPSPILQLVGILKNGAYHHSACPWAWQIRNPRCGDNCCPPHSGPYPCLNCQIGLVHKVVDLPFRAFWDGIPSKEPFYRCDSCDRWRFKADRAQAGVDDCLCVYDRETPYPACPHDNRGFPGAPGPVGSRKI